MNNSVKVIIGILVILLLGLTLSFAVHQESSTTVTNTEPEQVVCTMEAKLCLDGSYVGRHGPKCEFDACPQVSDPHANLIQVSLPLPNTVVSSPLTVTGEARGTWYFEASFPVRLFDANGKELAVKPAQAKGEWMTTEFVPFEVTLSFAKPTTATGTLVLEKDNPSGEAKYDDSISIPVLFTK